MFLCQKTVWFIWEYHWDNYLKTLWFLWKYFSIFYGKTLRSSKRRPFYEKTLSIFYLKTLWHVKTPGILWEDLHDFYEHTIWLNRRRFSNLPQEELLVFYKNTLRPFVSMPLVLYEKTAGIMDFLTRGSCPTLQFKKSRSSSLKKHFLS